LGRARPGTLNLITDVAGIAVGNAEDHRLLSGVTVVLPDEPAEAVVELRGGAPGTRETDALDPTALAGQAHAVVLAVATVLTAIRRRSELLGARVAIAGSVVVIAAGTYWFVQRVFFPTGA